MLSVRKFQVPLIKKYPRLIADPFSPKVHSNSSRKLVDFKELCRAMTTFSHMVVRPSNPKEYKKIRVEYKAVCSLLTRSNLNLNSFFKCSYPKREIHTSPPRSNKNEEDNKNKKKDDKKEDDNSSLQSLMFKAALWLMISLILVNVSTAVAPADNNQAEVGLNFKENVVCKNILYERSLLNYDEIEGMRYVSWNEFVYNMLSKGEVQEIIVRPDLELVTIVLYEGAVIKGKRVTRRLYHMNIGDIHRFEERLRDAEKSLGVKESVRVIYDRNPGTAGRIITFLLLGVAIISLILLRKNMKINISMDGFNQLGRAKFTLIDSANGPGKGVRFDDVAGLKEAKVEVMEFVDYLKRPEHYSNLGAKVPKGALLLGPPGCGKTLLAKAVATESNVPFLSMNGSEFVEMIGGLGAARVRDLFKEAKKRAPCIVYIDELDAVGRARAAGPSQFGAAGGESEQTLNQLLVEMDGMASREGIIVLGSTNRADVLDKALLRPGRFDRHILIDLPTLAERQEIFQRHLKNIVIEPLPENYVKKLAYMTPGFSGADIANVCNEAALHAARHKKNMVAATDLEYAVERVVGGTEKRSHAMSPKEKKIIAYHESGHVLMGWLLEHTEALLKVTIVPRTNLTLGFAQYTTSDQKLYSKEELFDRMCMALGGRAAEAIIFNSITSGARDDLDKVTKIAYAQVRQYGMSPAVGLVHFPDEDRRGKAPYSKTLKHLMDLEAKQLVADAYFRTMNILKENTDKLKLIADTLLKKESLGYKDIQELIGPPKYPKKFIDPLDFEQGLKEGIGSPNDTEMPPDAPSPKPNESRT